MAEDVELIAERAHLDLAERCLAAMREGADRIADYGVDALASEALGRVRAARLAALAADPDAPAFFGRTDRDPDLPATTEVATAQAPAEVLHIGRRHVRDAAGDPVVIDWRAPIARGFYQATPADRMGLRLRRRFGFRRVAPAADHPAESVLTSFEDERLDRGENLGLDSHLLREEIERPRVGPMRDIVATIQPDQDELVRLDLDSSICVQGAPGTGKTAVGLHRAAYLLYAYPERLRRSGVLVVGPNDAFLHYIAQVLPSLGEGGIQQETLSTLIVGGPTGAAPVATATEPTELARLKHDARMAEVLRRAVLAHVAKPDGDVLALVATKRYRIPEYRLRRYVDDARRSLGAGLRWTTARERLRMQLGEDVRRQREDAGGAPSDAETARVARSKPVKEFVDSVWPVLTPAALLSRLYADEDFRERCAGRLLDPEQVAALARPAARSLRRTAWTDADLVLLDELSGLLEPTPTWLHVVVDEAQDLSAMQCRAVARRCPVGSVTVLGDLAQATTPWAPGDWAVTLEQLGQPTAQVRPLTAGYRVPEEVLRLANRLLPHIASGVPPATSVRSHPDSLRFAPGARLVEIVTQRLDQEGSVGVIVADDQVPTVLAQLAGLDAHALTAETDHRLTVVGAGSAKGLEYDSVLVVEPERIVAAETDRGAGLRRLYVVLTRAVSSLTVLHDGPLPPELGTG